MDVLVAMSGGVDSSVATALLLESGHDAVGVTLKLWGGESDSGCCSVADVEDARRVAAQLGIPHYVFNLTDDFARDVVDPYVASHAGGETPNPCIECNRAVKFGRLLGRARAMGFDAVATGHHARRRHDPDSDQGGGGDGGGGVWRLLRGADAAKDQSYVLSMLGQTELSQVLFPVGELTKAEVRERAASLGLRTAAKPESMDVCFITRGGRGRFLSERLTMTPGPITDVGGRVVGSHEGVERFTVGQRRGLGVALGERRYVVDVDTATATVTVGGPADLLAPDVALRDLTFVHERPPAGETLLVQSRAHGGTAPGHLDGDRVVWDEPQPRVAPGQTVALYRDDELLAGAIAT